MSVCRFPYAYFCFDYLEMEKPMSIATFTAIHYFEGPVRFLPEFLDGRGFRESARRSGLDYDEAAHAVWDDYMSPNRTNGPRRIDTRHENLCWRCGDIGHHRKECRNVPIIFCSVCGLIGRLSINCCRTFHQDRAVSKNPSK